MQANLLRPDRQLAVYPGWDEVQARPRPRYRTEWWLCGSLVGATKWQWSPRRAIADGLEADESYEAVLHSHPAA